jgi:hypothetical protein
MSPIERGVEQNQHHDYQPSYKGHRRNSPSNDHANVR